MSVMIMNGWGVSVVMVSWEKNMIFLGSTGETRILRPYRKLYWSQSFLKASRFMYDLGTQEALNVPTVCHSRGVHTVTKHTRHENN